MASKVKDLNKIPDPDAVVSTLEELSQAIDLNCKVIYINNSHLTKRIEKLLDFCQKHFKVLCATAGSAIGFAPMSGGLSAVLSAGAAAVYSAANYEIITEAISVMSSLGFKKSNYIQEYYSLNGNLLCRNND